MQLLFHLYFSSWIIKATLHQGWSIKEGILHAKSCRGWKTLGYQQATEIVNATVSRLLLHLYGIMERGHLLDFCTLSWLNGCFNLIFTPFILVITLRFSFYSIHLFNCLFPAKSKKRKAFPSLLLAAIKARVYTKLFLYLKSPDVNLRLL